MSDETPATRVTIRDQDKFVRELDNSFLDEEIRDQEMKARLVARLRLVWENRRFLIRATCVGFVLSALITVFIPNTYQSTTRLMPPDENDASLTKLAMLVGQTGGGLGALAGDALGLKSSGALFVGVLKSRTVKDDIIKRFNLRKVYGDRRLEDARSDLADKTEISEDRKSGIITVKVSDRNPQRAAAMAQEYVEELNRVVAQMNTTSAHRERVFLEGRLMQVKADLESAEKSFSEFASKNAALNVPAQGLAMIESVGALQGQLIAAQTELNGLQQIYTDNNVRVRSLQARVRELRSQLQKLNGNSGTNSAPKVGEAEPDYPSIKQLPILGVGYADLYRQTKLEEAIFESLTREYELAKVEEAKETPSVKILDAPDVPEQKAFPPRMIIVLFCSMAVFAAGALFIFARARWDETDSNNAGKLLARDVLRAFDARMPWATPNGSRLQVMTNRAWVRLVRRKGSEKISE